MIFDDRGHFRRYRSATWYLATSLLVAALTGTFGCQSPYYAERGAGAGALTGALAGAAIGENNDRPITGAVIGSAVGAVTGAAIGDSMDRRREFDARARSAQQSALSIQDIIEMSSAGLSDDVIVRQIRRDGVRRSPDKHDLVALTQAGVGDRVIEELQATGRPVVYVPRPRPVVEHCYIGPPPPPRGFHAHWHH